MAKIAMEGTAASLHPRENQATLANVLAVANAATPVIRADGASMYGLLVTGVYVGTLVIEGSFDNTNWDTVYLRPVNGGGIYTGVLASAAVGRWTGPCQGFTYLRARMSAFTSGGAIVTLVADQSPSDLLVLPKSTEQHVETLGASGGALTLTVPAGGVGLFHYFTRINIRRYAAAVLTAAATPIVCTSTNLPGTRTFKIQADAAAIGVGNPEPPLEPSNPIRSSVSNTATTIVMPAITGVLWFAEVDYYLAALG